VYKFNKQIARCNNSQIKILKTAVRNRRSKPERNRSKAEQNSTGHHKSCTCKNTIAATTTPPSHDSPQTPADATKNDSLLEEMWTEWINTTSNAQERNPLWIDKRKMQQIMQ